jgi:hypothetical protein
MTPVTWVPSSGPGDITIVIYSSPWEATVCPWSCLNVHYIWPMGIFQCPMGYLNVWLYPMGCWTSPMVLQSPALYLSHGFLPVVQGTLQMSSIYLMGNWSLPMDLAESAPHPSHGHIPMIHGILHIFLLYAMSHCTLPMVLDFPTLHLSHGFLTVMQGTLWMSSIPSHGQPPFSHGLAWMCTVSVPWAYSNSPWDIANVLPLSHELLYITHGPVSSSTTHAPWVLYSDACLL